jgi:hypothetical protein
MVSERMGRALSAVGAVALIAGLFLVWYHIDRPASEGTTDTTGWQTFTRLRVLILVGAGILLLSAIVHQRRPVLIARTVLGIVLGALILRRIIDPPDISAPISAQAGVAVGLLGAIAAALGGLVDSGREVVPRYPDLAFWREPAGVLGPGSGGAAVERRGGGGAGGGPRGRDGGAVVDSTAEEL